MDTGLNSTQPDHYAALGLGRRCSPEQIRTAYRLLTKTHHPDVHGGASDAVERMQRLNAAYEVLSDPELRLAYDKELRDAERHAAAPASCARSETGGSSSRITKDVLLSIRELFHGTTLRIQVDDPGNPHGTETYELVVPPGTAPGTRFRLARSGRGSVAVRVKVRPDAQFKPRGSDLRCDLRISSHRAASGGWETLRGAGGNPVRVEIPPRVACRAVIRIPREGLPKAHGGRGDLLVRVMYRPDVRITRA